MLLDQVMRTPEGDVPVPITWAYNHHFVAYMSGAYSELQQLQGEELINPGMANHGAQATYMTMMRENLDDPAPNSEVPTSQMISEGNGGEFRKSYHGYPRYLNLQH